MDATVTGGRSNITFAVTAPTAAPTTWAAMRPTASRLDTSPSARSTRTTTGLKAADTGLQCEDHRGQHGTGDQGVLEELQARLAGRQPSRSNARADDGGNEEPAAYRFRGHPPEQRGLDVGAELRGDRCHGMRAGLVARTIAPCIPGAASWVNSTLAPSNPTAARPSRYSRRDRAPAMHPT